MRDCIELKFKKCIGYILKKERISQNISLRQLADYVGISAQFLSDIEIGKGNPSRYTFEKIQKELDVIIDITIETKEEAIQLSNAIYEAFIKFNLSELEVLFQTLVIHETKYKHSLGYSNFLLAKLVYYVQIDYNNPNIFAIIEELNELATVLTSNELLKYYDFCGLYNYKVRNYNIAQKYFEKASLITTKDISYERAMFYLHSCLYLTDAKNYFEAFRANENAINLFTNLCLFDRLNQCLNQKADILIATSNYEQAIEMIFYLLRGDKLNKQELYLKVIYCDLKKNNLKKALEDCLNYLEEYKNGVINFYISYLYWKDGKSKECLEFIKIALKNKRMESICSEMITTIQSYLYKDRKKVYESTKTFCNQCENKIFSNQSEKGYFIIYFDFLITANKEFNEYENAIILYELLNKFEEPFC